MSSPEITVNHLPEATRLAHIPLVVILGPTASGKTDLSIRLAQEFKGEIISADSRLFYRGMDIGTAKPSLAERAGVPHHLIDVADPDEIWSLAVFQQKANQTIHEVNERGHLAFLVGGTGQFIRAVVEGWRMPAVEPNSLLRSVLSRWADDIGAQAIHARLAVLDPAAAATIDYTNVRRTVRALEVIFSTGRRFSEQKETGHKLYRSLLIGLTCPRPELYQRIDERIYKMIDSGLVNEVRDLLGKGYSPTLPTMSAIGYGEILAYLHDDISLEEAVILMKRRTREFVRRQANWFKADDPDIHWYQSEPNPVQEVAQLIMEWHNIL
jgi:tRNA dimethylallyltransferase